MQLINEREKKKRKVTEYMGHRERDLIEKRRGDHSLFLKLMRVQKPANIFLRKLNERREKKDKDEGIFIKK